MNDKRLQDLLGQLDEPLSGDNFVEPLMKRLPASNNQRRRALATATAAAASMLSWVMAKNIIED